MTSSVSCSSPSAPRRRRPTALARAARWLAVLVGAGLASTAPAAAQGVTNPDQAPVAWIRYATSATETVTTLLQAESEAAVRLRAYLDATRPAPDQPTAPLLIKVWVEKDGRISRIDHAAFAHSEPNADLRALLVGAALPGAPPADMRLPLRILVQLPPAPASASSAYVEANRQLQPPAPERRPVTDPLGLPEPGTANRLNLPREPDAKPKS